MSQSLGAAVAVVAGCARPLAAEEIFIGDAAGRVLAEPVISRVELPPWNNAGMDGYALRADDISAASPATPVPLRILETVRAGTFPTRRVEPGTATRIMTGAPVPEGADGVVRVEDTDGGVETVEVRDARDARRNIRPRGEDAHVGDVILAAGAEIAPWRLGAIAAAGVPRVLVHRRPRVAVLSGGDELVSLDGVADAIAGERVIASNGYTLEALARDAGADVIALGVVPDDERALMHAMESAKGCDLLLTTGGVSVGAYDYAKAVFERMGGQTHFWRVRMRPGAQLAFGTLESLLWLGLPGNPASAVVTFEVFARPVIRRMLGHAEAFRRLVPVRVAEGVTTAGSATFFLRATLEPTGDGVLSARLSGGQGSHMQSSIARANALLVVPEGTKELAAGASCYALPLDAPASWSSAIPWPT